MEKNKKSQSNFSMWAAVFVVLLAVLLLVPFDPDVKIGDFLPPAYTGKVGRENFQYAVQDHYFPSRDHTNCHAWLYLPNNTTASSSDVESSVNAQLPVVIMGNGFAEQKDFGLDVYAEKFVARGFAVFLFDYRNFGPSDGVPRNLVSPKRHVEDWTAAVEFIQKTKGLGGIVNARKIGLWGVSFAGGHVLTVASRKKNETDIVGVVAQTPYLKASASTKKSSKKRGVLGKFRLALAAVQDICRGYLDMAPVVIPILGLPGQLAMMPSNPQRMKTYFASHPTEKLGGWINQGPVRGLFELRSYNPLETVRASPPDIPVLLVSGSRDALCPAHVIEEVHGLLKNSRVITRNATHLEIIGADHAHEVGEQMATFFDDCFQ